MYYIFIKSNKYFYLHQYENNSKNIFTLDTIFDIKYKSLYFIEL